MKNIIVVTNQERFYRDLSVVLLLNGHTSERRDPVSSSIQPKWDSEEWYAFKAFGPTDENILRLAREAVVTGARVALLTGSEPTRTSTEALNMGIHHCSTASVMPNEFISWLKRRSEIEYWQKSRLNYL